MACEQGWPTALPQGAHASLEAIPGGTRVTLRPRGWGRWVGIAFLLAWLAAWAVGEIVVLYVVVQAAAQGLHGIFFSHGMPGLFAIGVACFVLVWLALWTLGGIGAATTVLRLAWGADIFTVDSTGWTFRQVVGPFGRLRRFEAGAVERMGLRKRDAALVAEAAGRTEVLTTLGTPDERAWLRDLLRQAGRVAEGTSPRPFPLIPQPEPPPAGYVVEAAHDGSTRITPDARHRAAGIGCTGVAAVAWNAPLAGVVLPRLGLLPGHQAGGDWTSWLA
ncbi:MAG TPA: hypothetical protein VK689_00255, partial [Armatimonadota bacterium]|nr:hypothetical protein [Armatimonadota bacterium]